MQVEEHPAVFQRLLFLVSLSFGLYFYRLFQWDINRFSEWLLDCGVCSLVAFIMCIGIRD